MEREEERFVYIFVAHMTGKYEITSADTVEETLHYGSTLEHSEKTTMERAIITKNIN